MSEPALALQTAIYDAMRLSPALIALGVGEGSIFDRVPPKTDPFPRITFGKDQILDDGDSCGDAWEAAITIHVWTREPPGLPPAKEIAAAVRDVLTKEVDILGFRVVSALHRDTIYLSDPDEKTAHAVVTFDYLIDPAA